MAGGVSWARPRQDTPPLSRIPNGLTRVLYISRLYGLNRDKYIQGICLCKGKRKGANVGHPSSFLKPRRSDARALATWSQATWCRWTWPQGGNVAHPPCGTWPAGKGERHCTLSQATWCLINSRQCWPQGGNVAHPTCGAWPAGGGGAPMLAAPPWGILWDDLCFLASSRVYNPCRPCGAPSSQALAGREVVLATPSSPARAVTAACTPSGVRNFHLPFL
jgi:hypothetical protein